MRLSLRGVKLWILFLNFLEGDNIILMRNSVNLQNLKKWNERTVFGEKPTLRTYVQHSVIIITSRVLLEIKPIIENLVSEMNSISTVKWTIKVFRCFNPQIKRKSYYYPLSVLPGMNIRVWTIQAWRCGPSVNINDWLIIWHISHFFLKLHLPPVFL